MFYEKEIHLLAWMVEKMLAQVSNGSEWDIVVSNHLKPILPLLKKQLHTAYLNVNSYAANSSQNAAKFKKAIPPYLIPILKENQMRTQWSKLTVYDRTVFTHPESLQAISSFRAMYVLSLCYFFLYLRNDVTLANAATANQDIGLSPVQGKILGAFYQAIETFEEGGELYESLKNIGTTAKNLDAQMSLNDLSFFNTVAARLAFAVKNYIDNGN